MSIGRFLVITVLLTACSRVPSLLPQWMPVIITTADHLLRTHEIGEVAPKDWPYAISDLLQPESVRVHADGLYIVTSRYFVDEAGIFVARDDSWTDSDP